MPDHIVIGDIRPRVQYTADGTQTVFTYPFPLFAPGDLKVYLGEALQSSGYAVNGAGQSAGGTVVFTPTPPPAGTIVTLVRALAIARTSDFQEGGAFRAKTLNDELDRQTAFIQEVGERIERAIVAAPTEPSAPLVLPPPSERANRFLGFNASGAPIAAVGTGGVPVSAVMIPVVQAGALSDARAALGVPGLGDANLQLTPPIGIGAPAIPQSGLRIGYGSLSVTNADGGFGAGGNRAIVDVGGGYARVGAVNGGGANLDLALIARNGIEATLGNGMALSGATGGAQGVGTINAQNYFKNGAALGVGKVTQTIYVENTSYTSVSSVIPNDDTVPQNNEGTEIIIASITPNSATNRLRVMVTGNATGVSGNMESACALFRDNIANAKAAIRMVAMSTYGQTFTLLFEEQAGATSLTTYKARFGPLTSATVYINGDSGGRKFGGAIRWVIALTEIEP